MTAGSHFRKTIRWAAAPLPARVRYAGALLLAWRERGVHAREVVGVTVSMEGANHASADYDDAWLVALIKECDAFLDIGCNVGFFSLAACVLRPDARVVAIDANPRCAAVAAANLVRNGFGDRARAISAFVSDDRGEVTFHTVGLGAAGSGLEGFAKTAHETGTAFTVGADTVDGLCARMGFAPDLMKIDVEGAEREVLRGSVEAVRASQPRIIVEMHSGPSLSITANTAAVLEWCQEVGYDAWYLAEHVRLTDPEQVARRGRYHALLIPGGRPYPSQLRDIAQGASVDSVL